jgi:hypothetical protein
MADKPTYEILQDSTIHSKSSLPPAVFIQDSNLSNLSKLGNDDSRLAELNQMRGSFDNVVVHRTEVLTSQRSQLQTKGHQNETDNLSGPSANERARLQETIQIKR